MIRSVVLFVALCLSAATAAAEDMSALKAPGAIALMRHALAPGTGDPADFTLGECATQRNLDARGRDQARRTGALLREAGVAFDRVWASQWCRSTETAVLMEMGPVEAFPPINSFFGNRAREPEQTQSTLAALRALPEEARVLLVSHQVNITALTGIVPRSGEIVVARLGPDGLEVVDRVLVDP